MAISTPGNPCPSTNYGVVQSYRHHSHPAENAVEVSAGLRVMRGQGGQESQDVDEGVEKVKHRLTNIHTRVVS